MRYVEQVAGKGKGEVGLSAGAGEQAIMADPMESARQGMGQEPAGNFSFADPDAWHCPRIEFTQAIL